MKTFIAIALSVLICSFAKDTTAATVWVRSVEPRLSLGVQWTECRRTMPVGHVVERSICALPQGEAKCSDEPVTREDAVLLLQRRPACADTAVAVLEQFARADARVKSDLAAAYFVRAQQLDRPSDLLRALNTIEGAGKEPAALFNRALIQESAGLGRAAEASWNLFLAAEQSEWSAEARTHRDALARMNRTDAAAEWHRDQARLIAALHKRDRAGVAHAIRRFPSTAQRYLEEELLLQDLESARLLAEELAKINGDRYDIDVVESFARQPAREGTIAYGDARRAERTFDIEAFTADYDKAVKNLGENPLSLLARIGSALAESLQNEPNPIERAIAMLDPTETTARRAGYKSVLARLQATRGHFLNFQGRYLEALTEYDNALATYGSLHDLEGTVSAHVRKSGIFRDAGQYDLAWREAYQAMRHEADVPDVRAHHVLLGEVASAADALGFPRIALIYQNRAVEIAAQGDPISLAIALRHRAEIETHLGANEEAARDLDKVIQLTGDKGDPRALQILHARIAEVRGQWLISRHQYAAAAKTFTEAIDLAADDEFRTFRASLFAQRADAEQRQHQDTASERDLIAAVEELNKEQQRMLQTRKRGLGEELWSAYFSRFQEAYRLLIRLKMDKQRQAEGFAYAEKARAFEPLDLVLKLSVVPERFRDLAAAEPDVRNIQNELPAGTYLVEYCVLDDRTYAWIVSHDDFKPVQLRARRSDVERWSAALQQAAHRRSTNEFDGGLEAPYAELIARPLAEIETMSRKHPLQRLVFIPDGAMHGLPFAALRSSITKKYLIERAPVMIAPSAMLYLFSLFRDGQLPHETNPSVLLIGDPAFNPRLAVARDLDRLHYAALEVDHIHELYPGAIPLTDRNATVPALFEHTQDAAIVHIAAHTIVNAGMPSRSILLLAPSAHHTGALEAQELLTQLKLDRKTRLVVLSTCSSAGGLPLGPEGVAPLVRPLIAAGVPAVIGSLWDVGDATAETVMVSFHRHYRKSSDVATALQAAQVELLGNKNPGLRSVLAWAPFQVIGFASSPAEVTGQ